MYRKQPRGGMSVIFPVGGNPGHLTDKSESGRYFLNALNFAIDPILNAVTANAFVPPKFASYLVVSSFETRTLFDYNTKWQIQMGT